MKNISYQELKQKYLSLVDENRSLRARIRELESGKGSISREHLIREPINPDPGRGTDISPNARIIPGQIRINHYAAPDQKITLFMSLFKGRTDLYAKKWQNKKGKSGFSPVCVNEWRPGICNKPRGKCFKCSHKSHAPLTQAVVDAHLRGGLIVGIYPLNTDETCHFLAIDFDKQVWQQDISVIRNTCARFDIPIAVERSQSGNGCHAWFFFKHRIRATVARKFGTALLTHAMAQRHEISFSSYDRLFPNQDTMPRGGYGNLIALPFQKSARSRDNSVFIDENFTPWPDQWAFLSRITPLDETELNGWVSKLIRGQDLGELKGEPEEHATPWKKTQQTLTAKDFPQTVEIVRSAMLYMSKKGVSQRALDAIKRCAAFKNPKFYKAQAMRQSTFGIPRVISCVDDHETHMALPRGAEKDLCQLLEQHGARIKWTDHTQQGHDINVEFNGTLKPEQQQAVDALLSHDNGVLAAATAFGKTVVGAGLIAARKVNTLVLVHRQQLVSQWQERLGQFLVINETLPEQTSKRKRNLERNIIGHLAAGKDRLSSIVDVALMQSLNRSGTIRECVKNYGMIIVDECHHVPAITFEQILKEADAKIIYGLTATPDRPDGHHPIIFFYCGPVRFNVDPKAQAEKRSFDHCLIPRFTSFRTGPDKGDQALSLQEVYDRLASDEVRNQLIADDVIRCFEKGRTCLVLSGRRRHVAQLTKRLEKKTQNVFCLFGGMGDKDTARIMAEIRAVPSGNPFILVSTGSYIGEGFDEPRLDTLFLAMPISWKGTLQQYAGRLHRPHDNKKEVQVYDYVDLHVKMLESMYGKRLRGYAAIGYKSKVENFPDAPTNIIFTKNNFLPVYLNDLENARSSVMIVSPFMTQKRVAQMMAYFEPLIQKEVRITIITRPIDPFETEKKALLTPLFSMIRAAGIHLILKPSIHQKFAVIDDHITWYGSINLLSFGYSEESIMRLQSGSIAYELTSSFSGIPHDS